MSIHSLGFNQFFMSQLEDFESEFHRIARVISVSRGELILSQGEQNFRALWKTNEFPDITVGDFLIFIPGDKDHPYLIERVLDRKSLLTRRKAGSEHEVQAIAANVDMAFIVSSANREMKLNRLERYMVAVRGAGVTPVVVISKIDLLPSQEEQEQLKRHVHTIDKDVLILLCSSLHGDGVDELKSFLLPGTTAVVLGSSGVGKSSLINCLLGNAALAIGETSFDDKGTHTTTSRQLIQVAAGGIIIDTPGMREFQPMVAAEDLDSSFDDISHYFSQCRYRNCGHTTEDGCAVLAAIASGELDNRRWQNYLKIKRDQLRTEKKTSSNAKARWKQINKSYRDFKKQAKKYEP